MVGLGFGGFVKKFNREFGRSGAIGLSSGFINIFALLPVVLFSYKMLRGI